MNARTAEGYAAYASALRAAGVAAVTAPSGAAYARAFADGRGALGPASRFSCLYHHAGDACVPDGPGLGGHPSPLGTYLIALTMSAAVFRQSPLGVRWAPAGVSHGDAVWARRLAHGAGL